MDFVGTKESEQRVIIRSGVLPETCVGLSTCWSKPIDDRRSRNLEALGSLGMLTCRLKFPTISRSSDDMITDST